MSGVLTRHDVSVCQTLDMVWLSIDSRRFELYYLTSSRIAGGLRVACKAAMGIAGGDAKLWRDLEDYEQRQNYPPFHYEYRRSCCATNIKSWSVRLNRELVTLVFDAEVKFTFHCTDGIKLASQLNVACKMAKSWAGDASKTLICTGLLSDANAA